MAQGHFRWGLITGALFILLLNGCVSRPGVETDAATDASPAVRSLVESAHAARADGRLEDAAAELERALRLEPENSLLWHELAIIRRDQTQWSKAIAMAQRSNSFAGKELQVQNWMLIAECRRALGDEAGALEAEARAEALR